MNLVLVVYWINAIPDFELEIDTSDRSQIIFTVPKTTPIFAKC